MLTLNTNDFEEKPVVSRLCSLALFISSTLVIFLESTSNIAPAGNNLVKEL